MSVASSGKKSINGSRDDMSRQTEEAYEKRARLHDKECQRDLVLGATVYLPNFDHIEEGKVTKIDRIIFDSTGNEREDENGPYVRYHATFSPHHWVSQTYQWKWFYRIEDAKKALVKQMRERARTSRQEVDKWENLASVFELPIGEQ